MPTKSYLIVLLILISACDPNSYISTQHFFKDHWEITEVSAPSFPFDGEKDQSTIKVSFPKQGEFDIHLSSNICGGTYEANTNGTLEISGTNCTISCCDTDWDYYSLTLIRKVTSFEEVSENTIIFFINDTNYLKLQSRTKHKPQK